jgi:hypothetical protein
VQRFIDKILQQTKLSRESVKVLFKGRLLNNMSDEMM